MCCTGARCGAGKTTNRLGRRGLHAHIWCASLCGSRLVVAHAASRVEFRPLPVDDPKQRRPDIARARTLLQWEPKIELEEGLLKTVDYFKGRVGS